MGADLFRLILSELGLENVVTADDGTVALDYLYRRGQYSDRLAQEPGVALLDLKLPRISGWELLEHVRQHACLRLIPVIVLTSSHDPLDIERAPARQRLPAARMTAASYNLPWPATHEHEAASRCAAGRQRRCRR